MENLLPLVKMGSAPLAGPAVSCEVFCMQVAHFTVSALDMLWTPMIQLFLLAL